MNWPLTPRALGWSGDERGARILWARVDEPGTGRARQWIAEHGYIGGAHELLAGNLTRSEGVLARLRTTQVTRELERTDSLGGAVLIPDDAQWPTSLDQVVPAPHAIWILGRVELAALTTRSVAIVGSRSATAYGQQVAFELAAGVARAGWTVVSGAALGIDRSAHEGALCAGGVTVAALACGIDRAYPARHAPLLRDIADSGCVVSEVPLGYAPLRHRFLARNRLIAAISNGTILVEAGLRSGARSTVNHARNLARPVGVVPGPVTSMASAGCHQVLREGEATLVVDAEEVLELVAPIGEHLAPQRRGTDRAGDDLDLHQQRIYFALPVRSAASLEQICQETGLGVQEVMAALATMELNGYAHRQMAGWSRAAIRNTGSNSGESYGAGSPRVTPCINASSALIQSEC